jgi:predicted PurR-regulated permease PerM
MREDESTVGGTVTKDLAGTLIRVGLITFIVVMCARVFAPFADLIVWALILAIALYPMHQHLARRMGGRQGGAATVVVLAGLLIIGVPTVMLSASFASHLSGAHAAFQNNTVTIKQPASTVADWPVIGNRVYRTWSAAADNLPDFLEKNKEQFKNIAKRVLEAAVSSAGSVLMFLGSLIAAGIMMAYGESGAQRVRHIFTSVAGPITGSRLQGLTTATVRSVATGVIGVAFIQALLLGVGFMLAGIPAAGVLAAVVMLIGIMQLPALIISLPMTVIMSPV